MSEIDALQSRITAALDRIAQGLERTGEDKDPARIEALEQALEHERLANAQLEERIMALRGRLAAATDAAETARQAARDHLTALDRDLQSLRKVNQQLRDSNQALREANAEGVAEPDLINAAMLAELEGLRAAQAADRAEIDAVLGEMSEVLGPGAGPDRDEKEDA